MSTATAPRPACVVLTSAHDANTVRKFLDNGQTDVDSVVVWASEVKQSVADLVVAFAGVFDPATLGSVIASQQALAVASAVSAVKQSSARGITWKVSKRGLVSVYGLNARFPVSLYLPQLKRFASSLFGIDGKAFDESPIGKWAATNPTEVFPVSDYESEADKGWLTDARTGKYPHVIVKGDGVAVSLSLAAPE